MSSIPIDIIKDMFPMLSEEKIRDISKKFPNASWDTLFDQYELENKNVEERSDSIKTRTGDSPEPFDPLTFKVFPCQDLGCAKADCPRYHSEQEKRRNPSSVEYEPVPCEFVFREGKWNHPSECPHGDRCLQSHSHLEIMHHTGKIEEEPIEPVTLERQDQTLAKEISELMLLNNCNACRTEEYIFICDPCLHTLCYYCRHQSENCPMCQTEVRYLQRPSN